MNFEDAEDMANLYNISPSLTCTCDEFHLCQQCHEEKDEIEFTCCGDEITGGGEIEWKSISTITFNTKKEAVKRLGLMNNTDDYRNLKVVKTTNGYAVLGEQKKSEGGSTYAEGGMTEMSKRIEFADKMAQYVAYQKDKTGRKSDSWYDKTERKLKQQGFDKLYKQYKKLGGKQEIEDYAKGGSTYAEGGKIKIGDKVSTEKFTRGFIEQIDILEKDVEFDGKKAKKGEKLYKVIDKTSPQSTLIKGGWFTSSEIFNLKWI